MRLARAVERTLRRHAMLAGGETVLVGVSGGSDSVALLAALRALAPGWRLTLRVLHVDHGLRADSARDAEFVRALGARLGVPVDVACVTVGPGSLEAAARAARYAALEAAAARVGATRIALGHTADDQAETVLMRLLAGAGVRGLAGIPPVRGAIIRPLIATRRAEIRAALAEAGLEWREDPTNRDLKHARNRIRHELLPLLASSGWPEVVDALDRVAVLAREAVEAIDTVAAREFERLGVLERGAVTLPRPALAALPRAVAVEILRRAAMHAGAREPLRAWAHRGLARVLAGPPPRRRWSLGGVGVEVSGERIRVGAAVDAPLAPRTLAVPGRIDLPEVGLALEARRLSAAGYAIPRGRDRVAFDAAGLPPALVVRARRAGDRFRPYGGGERRLKTFLIDARVPRWERERLPLVEAGGEILWVAGLRRAAAAPITPGSGEVVELALVPLAKPPSGE